MIPTPTILTDVHAVVDVGSLIVTVTLLLLLSAQEISRALGGRWARRLYRLLVGVIVPLGLIFSMTAIIRVLSLAFQH